MRTQRLSSWRWFSLGTTTSPEQDKAGHRSGVPSLVCSVHTRPQGMWHNTIEEEKNGFTTQLGP